MKFLNIWDILIDVDANDLLTGIPELNLPPIEPLVIPELKMENGQGPVRVRAYFTNITAIGAGNYTLKKVRVNISSYRIDIHLSFPKIEIQGNYDINGNVLLFPIQSHGNFWALFGKRIIVLRKNIFSIILLWIIVRISISDRMCMQYSQRSLKYKVTLQYSETCYLLSDISIPVSESVSRLCWSRTFSDSLIYQLIR